MSNTVKKKEIKINVQNMAGVIYEFMITDDTTVRELKVNIMSKKNLVEDCEPEFQKLMMMPEEEKSNGASAASSSNAPTHTVLDDDSRTLFSYRVLAGTTLYVICNVRYLKPHSEIFFRSVGKMAISPNNNEIYFTHGNKIEIFNIQGDDSKEIDFRNDTNPIEDIKSVCLSPTGEYFFILGKDTSTIPARSIIQKRRSLDKGYEYTIRAADIPNITDWYTICTNATSVFAADVENNIISVFEVEYGTPLRTIGSPGEGIGQLMTPMDMAITSNDELFVLEWSNKRVQVFRATTGEPLRHFIVPNILYVMDVSPDGNYMYINDRYNRGAVHVLDAFDGVLLETVTLDVPTRRNIEDICVSPDGNFVFVSTREKIIQYATPGSKMGGRRHKKGMRRRRGKSRVQRLKKKGTKRKQRK
jgi:hypothetical protein